MTVSILHEHYRSIRNWRGNHNRTTARGFAAIRLVVAATLLVKNYQMIVVIYLLLSFLITDIVLLANLGLHFAPAGMKDFRLGAFVVSLVLILVAMLVGN